MSVQEIATQSKHSFKSSQWVTTGDAGPMLALGSEDETNIVKMSHVTAY